MSKKSKRKKQLTEAEQTKIIKRIQQQIENHRKSIKKGDIFISISEEELKVKLGKANSPFISSHAFPSAIRRGGTINYSVGISNPDPIPQIGLFAHVFFGTGNVVEDEGMFLLNVDSRFPRLTQPGDSLGLTIAPGDSAVLEFTITTRSTIQPSGYICNTALIRTRSFDIGTLIDRGALVLQLTA